MENFNAYKFIIIRKISSDPDVPCTSASEVITFLAENPEEFCNRLRIIVPEKQRGNDTNIFDYEIVAIIDKLFEYKCVTKTPQKCFSRF